MTITEKKTRSDIGLFEGAAAKSVKAHADSGIGYFILSEGGSGARIQIKAAFLLADDGSVPYHLQTASTDQVLKLEKLNRERKGQRVQA